MNTSFALLLVLLFTMSLVLIPSSTARAQTRTLVVPDQYLTIQDAINNASAGDTVFVKSGVYYNETIDISKALNLVGENPDTTYLIGYGLGYPYFNLSLIEVNLNEGNFFISNFTIENASRGIDVFGNWLDGKIVNCNILNNSQGIQINGYPSYYDIQNDESPPNHVELSGNIIMDNNGGVAGANGYLDMYNNTITHNFEGSSFGSTFDFHSNIISHNTFGLDFTSDCNNCSVENNVIQGNFIGIYLERFIIAPPYDIIGKNNQVTENNFLNNTSQVKVEAESDFNTPFTVTDVISWDGNYWSDYKGQGSYVIDENNIDHNPLTQQVSIYSMSSTALTTFLITIAVVVAVIAIAILLLRRHRKIANLRYRSTS